MKKTLILILLAFAPCLTLLAADGDGDITLSNVSITSDSSQVAVSMGMVLDGITMGRNRQMLVTPYMEDGKGHVQTLPTVLINGRNMHYVYRRSGLPAKIRQEYGEVKHVVARDGSKPQTYAYVASVPAQSWIRRGQVSLRLSVDRCGCGVTLGSDQSEPLAMVDMNPAPSMRLCFVTPPVTDQPVVSHEGRARVQFEVDSITLHTGPYVCRNGQRIDNREQLGIIHDSISYALSDPNVEIAAISVCGYASPESPYVHNDYLATNRSRSLSEYLGKRYSLPSEHCTYSAVPENWEEFRQQVVESADITPAQREALLQLIDRPTYGPSDYDAKEAELKTSKTFSRLYREKILPQWFPMLRCTKFVINTRLRPMPDEKLAEIIAATPQLMTLNQMFRVARLYPEGSEEFNRTIATALRYYASDPVANANAAIAAIKEGRLGEAETYLDKAGNLPEAENARGVLATYRGDYEAAVRHFDAAGILPEAQKNKALVE